MTKRCAQCGKALPDGAGLQVDGSSLMVCDVICRANHRRARAPEAPRPLGRGPRRLLVIWLVVQGFLTACQVGLLWGLLQADMWLEAEEFAEVVYGPVARLLQLPRDWRTLIIVSWLYSTVLATLPIIWLAFSSASDDRP